MGEDRFGKGRDDGWCPNCPKSRRVWWPSGREECSSAEDCRLKLNGQLLSSKTRVSFCSRRLMSPPHGADLRCYRPGPGPLQFMVVVRLMSHGSAGGVHQVLITDREYRPPAKTCEIVGGLSREKQALSAGSCGLQPALDGLRSAPAACGLRSPARRKSRWSCRHVLIPR